MQPTNDTSPIKKFLDKKGQGHTSHGIRNRQH